MDAAGQYLETLQDRDILLYGLRYYYPLYSGLVFSAKRRRCDSEFYGDHVLSYRAPRSYRADPSIWRHAEMKLSHSDGRQVENNDERNVIFYFPHGTM